MNCVVDVAFLYCPVRLFFSLDVIIVVVVVVIIIVNVNVIDAAVVDVAVIVGVCW